MHAELLERSCWHRLTPEDPRHLHKMAATLRCERFGFRVWVEEMGHDLSEDQAQEGEA